MFMLLVLFPKQPDLSGFCNLKHFKPYILPHVISHYDNIYSASTKAAHLGFKKQSEVYRELSNVLSTKTTVF